MEGFRLIEKVKRTCEALAKSSGSPIAIVMKNNNLIYIIICEEYELINPGNHLFQNDFTGVDILQKVFNNEFTNENSPSGESNINTYVEGQTKYQYQFGDTFDVLLINESLD